MEFWPLLFFACEWAVRLVMLPFVMLRQPKPSTCLAWLAIVSFEPWIGLVLYLLIGEKWLGRRRLRHRRYVASQRTEPTFLRSEQSSGDVDPGDAEFANDIVDPSHLSRLALSAGGMPPLYGSIDLVSNCQKGIDQLIESIDAATHHVHLLFYIFRDDVVGRAVGEALLRAKGRNVECRVLVDAVGSRNMLKTLGQELNEAGVAVVPALPASLLRRGLSRIDLRNHRKIAVIDGRVAHTGSQNIVEPTYGHRRGGEWKDIMARVEGEVVHAMQHIFLEDWCCETGEEPDGPRYFPEAARRDGVPIQVVPTGPDRPGSVLHDLVTQSIHDAREQVTITTPYFVPDEPLLQSLRIAAQRGVRVRIILPDKSDLRITDAARLYYCNHLSKFGVRTYLYKTGLLHAKSLTVDNSFGMFGSANFDIRSFFLNFELMLLVYQESSVRQLRDLQEVYVSESETEPLAEWDRLPLRIRVAGNVAKLLSPLL